MTLLPLLVALTGSKRIFYDARAQHNLSRVDGVRWRSGCSRAFLTQRMQGHNILSLRGGFMKT